MIYINPFELLEISSNEPKIVEDATTWKLALIRNSNEGYILYGSNKIDHNKLLSVVADLKNPQLADYHHFILQRPRLLRFLKTGDSIFFEYYKSQKKFSSYPFKEFIGPYFAEAFNHAFVNAFKKADIEQMRLMLEIPALTLPELQPRLFDSVKTALNATCDRLKELLYRISYSFESWNNLDARNIKNKAIEGWDVTTVNALPDSFEPNRTKLALLLSDLAIKLEKQFPTDQGHFFELIETAMALKVSKEIQEKIKSEYNTLYAKHQEKMEHGVEKQKVEIRSVLDRLRLLQEEVKQEKYTADKALSAAKGMIQLAALERLPASLSNAKQTIAQELNQLALVIWETEEDLEAFKGLLQLAMSIAPDKVIKHSTPKSSEDLKLTLLAIRSLRQQTRERRQGTVSTTAHKITELLQELLSVKLCAKLLRTENDWFRQEVLRELLPVIHFCRRREPVKVLHLLEQIRPLTNSSQEFQSRINETDQQIIKDLNQGAVGIKESKTFKAPVKRDPLERVSVWELIQDQYKSMMAFLMEERSGPNRLVQLGVVFGVSSFLVLMSVSVVPMLFEDYPVESTSYQKQYEVFVPLSERPIAEYVKKKSLYEGNFLKNGSRPFQDCFGPEPMEATNNQITVKNPTEKDVVAVLYYSDKHLAARHVYIRKNQYHTFRNLPIAAYKMRFYTGSDWNPIKPNFCGLHGAFDTDPRYYRLSYRGGLLECPGNTSLEVVLDWNAKEEGYFKKFPYSTARSFFFTKNLGLEYDPKLLKQE